jgi:class 3 adenylate cyclase
VISAPREERKVVTVLFTDLVGFTGRAEQLDPEDVRAMLSPYYATLRREIERHGGLVEKFIGDAVMAVFGAPVAHEDDPERAVRAALAIRRAIVELNEEESLELAIRTGINTGEALVALGARPVEGEGMVSGDVVNTAARLEAAAPVGAILVGEMTFRATQERIEYREATPIEAKGKSRAVPAWEAVDARSHFGIDVAERTRQIVGRAREVALLADALERSRTDETAQLVTLVGVPGIGKSRLVAELFAMVDASPDVICWWRQGRSLPYGETQSFWALAEIVKAQAGILESDSADAARQKLAATVTALVGVHEREWVDGHLAPLVGIGDVTADTDRGLEAFAAWRRFLEALAEQRPLILVFEDLHWADDGLLDFVDHLADWVTTVPMLIVATSRPELLERRPGWGGGKRNAATVSLSPLAETDAAKLLSQLLDQVLLPAEVQANVLARSAGNPLFTEEYVRMLQDRGFLVQDANGWRLTTEDLPLPESVQGMIAARLDALPEGEKEIVQDAAVVGKVFWPSALATLAERRTDTDLALHALTRKEFIRRDRNSALADDTQYAFLHALVRDVAYAQIPRAHRAAKHRAAADWLEGLAHDRSQDRSEMLAYHLRAALELAEATGQDTESLRPRLCAALVAASQRAESLFAWPAARDRAREALLLLDDSDARAASELALRVARASLCLGDYDVEAAALARDRSLAAGDVDAAAIAEGLRAQMHWYRGEGNDSKAADTAAAMLVADRPPSAAKAWVLAQTARREVVSSGDLDSGQRIGREALAMAESFDRHDLAAHALNTIGLARTSGGDPGGIADLERSIEVAAHASAAVDLVGGINNLANALWGLGRLAEASAQRRRHQEECERFGLQAFLVWGEAEAAYDSYLRGAYPDMVARAERFIAAHSDEVLHQLAPQLLVCAHGYSVAGRIDEALPLTTRGLLGARESAASEQVGFALMVRAHALQLAGQTDDARPLLNELLSEPSCLAHFHWLAPLALLCRELGRSADYLRAIEPVSQRGVWRDAAIATAAGDLLEAAGIYDRIGSRFVAAWARLLAAEEGDASELKAAETFLTSIAAAPYLRRCEQLFSASA